VRPGDNFHGINRNATGCIGVIVRPRSPDSIVDVGHSDVGSGEDEDGNRDASGARDISIEELRSTLDRRVYYNEWVVKDYEVLGILAVEPFEVWGKKSLGHIPEEARHLFNDEPRLN